jgi:hypothetical protein
VSNGDGLANFSILEVEVLSRCPVQELGEQSCVSGSGQHGLSCSAFSSLSHRLLAQCDERWAHVEEELGLEALKVDSSSPISEALGGLAGIVVAESVELVLDESMESSKFVVHLKDWCVDPVDERPWRSYCSHS